MTKRAPKSEPKILPVRPDPAWTEKAAAMGWPLWQIARLGRFAGAYVEVSESMARVRFRNGRESELNRDSRTMPNSPQAWGGEGIWRLQEAAEQGDAERAAAEAARPGWTPPKAMEGDTVPSATYGTCQGCGFGRIVAFESLKCSSCGGWGVATEDRTAVEAPKPPAPVTMQPWQVEALAFGWNADQVERLGRLYSADSPFSISVTERSLHVKNPKNGRTLDVARVEDTCAALAKSRADAEAEVEVPVSVEHVDPQAQAEVAASAHLTDHAPPLDAQPVAARDELDPVRAATCDDESRGGSAAPDAVAAQSPTATPEGVAATAAVSAQVPTVAWADAARALGWPEAQVAAISRCWPQDANAVVEERKMKISRPHSQQHTIFRRDDFAKFEEDQAARRALFEAEEPADQPLCAPCARDGLERHADVTHPETGEYVCDDWPQHHPRGETLTALIARQEAEGYVPVVEPEVEEATGDTGPTTDDVVEPEAVTGIVMAQPVPVATDLVDPATGEPWAGLEAWTDASASYPKHHDDPPGEAGIGIAFVRCGVEVKRFSRQIPNAVTYVAELRAIEVAIMLCPPDEAIYVVSDNESAVRVLRREFAPRAADRLVQRILEKIDARAARGVATHLKHVKGHSGSIWNDLADYLAWMSVRDFRVGVRRDPTVPKAPRAAKAPKAPKPERAPKPKPAIGYVRRPEDDLLPDTREMPKLLPPHERKQLGLFR